ncbi:MAG: AAA family ATPase [Armatimonadota bacterium]|jgi:exonuclease SbcC
MILRRLRLRRFGRFAHGEWEFGPGLTVIRGPNEAGKSTMREAIVRLLLPEKKIDTRDSSYMALRSWGADQRFVLACEFEADGESYELLRDFEAGRVELRGESGEALTDEPAIAERLWELLGVSSRAVYETTACLAQQEFVRLEAGEKVAELLQQTVVGAGAETGAQSVLAALDSESSALARGLDRPAKNPGAVRATRDRVDALQQEITRLRPIVERAAEAADRMERARERIEEIERELQQALRIRERAEERRKLEERLEGVRKEFRALDARAREARELTERVASVEARLDDLPDVSRQQVEELAKLIDAAELAEERVPEAEATAKSTAEEAELALARVRSAEDRMPDEAEVGRVKGLERDVEEIEGDVRQAEQIASGAEEDLLSAREAARGQRWWLVAAGVLIVAGAGLALGLGEAWPWVIAGAGLVVGVMGSLRGPRIAVDEAARRHERAEAEANDRRAKLSAMQDELAGLLREAGAADAEALACELRQAREIIEDARKKHAAAAAVAQTAIEQADRARQQSQISAARLKHRLEQLGADSSEQFLLTAREVFDLREQAESLRARLEGVLGGEALEEIDETLSELSGDRMGLQQRLDSEEMAWAALDAESFEELQSRIEGLEAERERLRAQIDGARGAADHPEADPEHLRRLEEQQAAAEDQLERVRARLDALLLARELLAQAHEETLAQAIDVLEPRTSELIAGITGGRYCAVQFDRATLDPSVHSAEKGEPVDPDDELSCATREQVYLAARLALTELLWPEDCPPIILDDPFVNFDGDRREESLRVVRRLAASRQVLLFTCHDHYDRAADRIVELPAP